MESLIARWKKTSNSGTKLRQSEQKQNDASKLTSNEKSRTSPASQKDPDSASSDSSNDSFRLLRQKESAKKSTPSKNRLKQSQVSIRQSNISSDRKKLEFVDSNAKLMTTKNPSNFKQNVFLFSQALDSTTYTIVQIFRHQLSPTQIIEQLKIILMDFAEQSLQLLGQGQKMQELQFKSQQQEKQLQILKSSQSSTREDMSRKLISELENKLVTSESQRVQINQQKETLSKRFDELLQEVQKLSRNQSKCDKIENENEILQKNNQVLLQQLQLTQESNKQQQIIWDHQVEDLIRMMDILKEQLQKS